MIPNPNNDAIDDSTLAKAIEGLLNDDEQEQLNQQLEHSEPLRIRLKELESLFAEQLTLPDPPCPDGLAEVIMARLEVEGLIADPLPNVPLPSLEAKTMDRLHDEGLLSAQSSDPRNPKNGSKMALFVVLILAFGAGFTMAWWLRPQGRVKPEVDAVKALKSRVESLERELQQTKQQKPINPKEQELSEALKNWQRETQQRQQLEVENAKLKQEMKELSGQSSQLEELQESYQQLSSRFKQSKQDWQSKQSQLTENLKALTQSQAQLKSSHEQQLGQRDSLLASVTQERKELALQVKTLRQRAKPSAPPAVQVLAAQGVARWDSNSSQWRALKRGDKLRPGALLKAKDQSRLRVGRSSQALIAGLFRLGEGQELEPIPSGCEATWSAPEDRPTRVIPGVQRPKQRDLADYLSFRGS